MRKFSTLIAVVLLFQFQSFAQSIELNSAQINFGLVYYGNADSVLVEITNLTSEELEIQEPVFFDVYNSSPFYVNAYPATLNANETSSFFVVYNPVHNMAHNSEMVVVSNRGAAAIDLHGDCKYPEAYYDPTYNLFDEVLESAFKVFLASGYNSLSYNAARDQMYMVLDNQKVNGQGSVENRITRVYLGTDIVGFSNRSNAQTAFGVDCEHTYPQGFFNKGLPMRTDLHHLYVTDANANSTRSNYAFGKVESNITWQSGGSKRGKDANGVIVFEPRDAHKGKAARAILYFLLRYQNYGNHVTSTYEQTIREWHETFPPDAIDVKRNDDIEGIQNNRNPFVDYPQFLDRIYNLRAVEDRPEAGYVAVSTQVAEFGDVSATGDEVYNIVLTNYGNETVTIGDLEFTDNSTSSFSLDESLSTHIPVQPGESVNVPIICTAISNSEDLEAMLHFTTDAVNGSQFSIPVSADFTTNITRIDAYAEITVSPNPFSSQIEFNNLDQQISDIKLYDISGRIVFAQGGGGTSINIPNLNSGIYQMVVTLQDGGMFTRKLMKQ